MKHHFCFISHGATPGPDDVTGQGDLAGWPYLYYRALEPGHQVRSSFILRTTYPQSSVTPPLAGPGGRRPPGMWSPSRPPAVVVATWLEGHTSGMGLVVATSKGQSRPPGRRPLWPTQTHLLHPMAPKWSELTEGALSNQTKSKSPGAHIGRGTNSKTAPPSQVVPPTNGSSSWERAFHGMKKVILCQQKAPTAPKEPRIVK